MTKRERPGRPLKFDSVEVLNVRISQYNEDCGKQESTEFVHLDFPPLWSRKLHPDVPGADDVGDDTTVDDSDDDDDDQGDGAANDQMIANRLDYDCIALRTLPSARSTG